MTVVAIDGPAGAGKSTVAREVAAALGFDYLDTGAMYRAVALVALERGIVEDPEAVGRLAATLHVVATADAVTIDGRDVTERIRDDDVTAVVSRVAAEPAVRSAMVERQRRMSEGRNVVMEGRDIGTTVVPGASVKVFLDASAHERARRRVRQLGLVEDDATVARLAASLGKRDAADSSRSTSPLSKAEDAIKIDSTGRDVAAVVAEIVNATRRTLDAAG